MDVHVSNNVSEVPETHTQDNQGSPELTASDQVLEA